MDSTQAPHGNQSRHVSPGTASTPSFALTVDHKSGGRIGSPLPEEHSRIAFCSTLLKAHSSCLEKLLCTIFEDLVAMVVGDTSSRDGPVFDPYDPILTDADPRPAPMMNP